MAEHQTLPTMSLIISFLINPLSPILERIGAGIVRELPNVEARVIMRANGVRIEGVVQILRTSALVVHDAHSFIPRRQPSDGM
jgi:hypothetical protein